MNEHQIIKNVIGHEIKLWIETYDIEMRIIETFSGRWLDGSPRPEASEWDFRTTGKNGGSPNICLIRKAIFCHAGIFVLKNKHNQNVFELADPQLLDKIKCCLVRIFRILEEQDLLGPMHLTEALAE
tara:strand:- start:3401 stop:3781 length:381 start_codon:yes stop_codon:yes gene_type:complete